MQYRPLALGLGALLLGACGGDDSAPIDAAGPADANLICLEALNHSDLPWIQENIFTPSCSRFTACHQGRATMAGELSLEDGTHGPLFRNSYDELINVESVLFPEYMRVVPGDAVNSYLMLILGHYGLDVDLPDTGTMPYNSPLLCVEMRDAIERWIDEGALEVPPDAMPPDAMPPDAMP